MVGVANGALSHACKPQRWSGGRASLVLTGAPLVLGHCWFPAVGGHVACQVVLSLCVERGGQEAFQGREDRGRKGRYIPGGGREAGQKELNSAVSRASVKGLCINSRAGADLSSGSIALTWGKGTKGTFIPSSKETFVEVC